MLKLGSMAPAAGDGTGLPALSIVGSFFRLPWLEYAGGLVVLPACSLALAAARAPLVALHGDAQNDSKLTTTRDGLAVVGFAGPWPRCDVPALPPHDAQSDSPAR